MPIFYDRIADQVEELLPEYYQKDGPRFISFIKSYFEFLEKGQLIYKDAADIDYIGLEDGTTAGELPNSAGERGNLLQEEGTYAPSSITNAKFNYEIDIDGFAANPSQPEKAKTAFEQDEYVVGSRSKAVGRVDVIGTSSKLYIEQFSEAQFEPEEIITGQTSGMTATVASFKASPLQAANNLLSYADIDKTSGDFLEFFRRDFMPFIDRDVLANKRLLNKHIKDLYLAKGSKESYEFLFRILYGLEAEVSFPSERVLRPSDSAFSEKSALRLFSTKNLLPFKTGLIQVLDGSGVAIKQAFIDEIEQINFASDGENSYEVTLETPFTGEFTIGETVVVKDRDNLRAEVTAIVRGSISDVDPNSSNIYVGLEDGQAGDLEDIVVLENSEHQNLVLEDVLNGDNLVDESGNQLILNFDLGSQIFEPNAIRLESTEGGIILTEESVYNDDTGFLETDFAILHEQTDSYPNIIGAPDTRRLGAGVSEEQASRGSLYSLSDKVNFEGPRNSTTTTKATGLIDVGRGGVTEIILDDAGSGYVSGDMIVFDNSDTEGSNAEAEVKSVEDYILLENATEYGIFTFTLTSAQAAGTASISGHSTDPGLPFLGFDPRKVRVFIGANTSNLVEKTRITHFTTDQAGLKITLTEAAGASAGNIIEIHASHRGIRLESSLEDNPIDTPFGTDIHPNNNYLVNETSGSIRSIKVTNPGTNYRSPPKAYFGGYVYYDTLTYGGSATDFTIGETVTANSVTMIVVRSDLDKKRILVRKTNTSTNNVSGTATAASSSISFTVTKSTVTNGVSGKVLAYGDSIGSVLRSKMDEVGHNHAEPAIGVYENHALIKDITGTPRVDETITSTPAGVSATISSYDSDKQILSLKNVRGLLQDGEFLTSSGGATMFIAKVNPATMRGLNSSVSTRNGNYLDVKGFPSEDSQRIHDSSYYQDYSYLIKVGKTISEYRSLVKSLLSPAGTIFFGEVSIRNQIDVTPDLYNVSFDTTNQARSFIPRLVIGSKVDAADIQLEDATKDNYLTNDSIFPANEGRIELESADGVIRTERFLCTDTTAADHNSHNIKDQSSGQRIYTPDISEEIDETDKAFNERILTANAGAKGNRVTKELEISPHFNQHKISYSTLDNALAVGTKVKGGDDNSPGQGGARGIVMEHNTSEKYIIVHQDLQDQGNIGVSFTIDAIEHIDSGVNYFTATSVELHYAPENSTEVQTTSITADQTAANKTATEGGAEPYDHTNTVSGFTGRGKTLVAADNSEYYDSEMKQRRVNIVSSPIFARAATQRGRTYSAGVKQTISTNTQSSRTLGSNTVAANSNGTALRIDSNLNTTEMAGGYGFGYRQSGQKLFDSFKSVSENLITESGDRIIPEPLNGQFTLESGTDIEKFQSFSLGFGGFIVVDPTKPGPPDQLILEDGSQLHLEEATVNDEIVFFVSEESTADGSFILLSETTGDRIVSESEEPILLEEALMIEQNVNLKTGPTISDLGFMSFNENYSIMANFKQEGSGSTDNMILEDGNDLILESPHEGIRISDISTIYPKRFVSTLERDRSQKINLNHSAVIQTG